MLQVPELNIGNPRAPLAHRLHLARQHGEAGVNIRHGKHAEILAHVVVRDPDLVGIDRLPGRDIRARARDDHARVRKQHVVQREVEQIGRHELESFFLLAHADAVEAFAREIANRIVGPLPVGVILIDPAHDAARRLVEPDDEIVF